VLDENRNTNTTDQAVRDDADTDLVDDAAGSTADRAAELEDHLRGALADLDNLRKRFDREVTRERHAERGRAAAMWLPVVDDLERALQHAGADAASIVAGVEAVVDHAQAVLGRLGFPRFDDLGSLFDPHRDEAISAVDADAPPGTVVATVRPGYGTDAEILRPASVVVAKRKDAGSG
jgi:molecular chaperone GrpE